MDPKSLTLKEGDTDPFGNKVSQIFATDSTKKYAIWETTQGKVLVDTDSDDLNKDARITTWTLKLTSLISRHKILRGNYNSQIAYAYKLCLDGNADSAVTALETTYNEVVKLLKDARRTRLSYLLGALVVTAVCSISWLVWYYGVAHPSPPGKTDLVLDGAVVAVLGGFLSVAVGLRDLDIETEESFWMNMVYGALRIVVALICGFVATLMIRTGIALTFLQQQDAFGGFLLACFLAGYSERFITQTLRGIESDA